MTDYDLYALKVGAEALRLMRGSSDEVAMEMRRHATSSDFDGVYRIAANPFQISFADLTAQDVREAEVMCTKTGW